MNRLTVIRIFGSLALAVLAWDSGFFSFSQVTRYSVPASALAAVPLEPVALVVKADTLWAANPTSQKIQKTSRQLARAALSEQALNPRAMRVFAFANAGSWDQAKQRRAIDLAYRGSRRDAGIYLWRIEDSVGRDNIPEVLANYDLSLMTTSETSAFLFPLLTSALEDARIREAFVPYLKRNPAWLNGFIGFAISNSANPTHVSETILLARGLPKDAGFQALEQALLGKLVDTGHLDEAKAFVLGVEPKDKVLLTSIAITDAQTAIRSPVLAWTAIGSASAGASLGQSGVNDKTSMRVFAASGDRQIVARKLLYLNAGNYQLEARYGDIQAPRGAAINWYLRCLGKDSATPPWTSGPTTPLRGASYRVSFTVPTGCATQALEIEMIGGQEQRDAEFELMSLRLTPSEGVN
jgi:hypothetical protein